MMNTLRKDVLLKNIILFFISMIISYIVYQFISMNMINAVYNIDSDLKGIFLYLCHVESLYLLLKIVTKLKIYKFEKIILVLSYFLLMMLMFFDRVDIGKRVFNLDVFDLIHTIKAVGVSSSVLNILIFIPFYTAMKWLQDGLHGRTICIVFLLFSIGIETIQYITMCGIFDVVDIILYVIGFIIGKKMYDFLFIRI